MKLKNWIAASLVAIASVFDAAAEPLLQATVRSYGDLTNAIATFGSSFNPTSKTDYAKAFCDALGLVNQAGFDGKKPWQIAVWLEEPNQPLMAIKAPADDVNLFKDSFGDQGLIRAKNPEFSQLKNGLSMIVFNGGETLAESKRAALDLWKNAPLGQPSKAFEITLSLSDGLRQQAMGLLGIAKMSVAQAMSAQAAAAQGINPKAMGEIIQVYFEVIDVLLGGFAQAKIGLDLKEDALLVDKVITPRPDTQLAKWLQKSTYPLSAQDYTGIDPNAFVSFAASLGKDPGLMQFAEKMTLAGLSMQSTNVADSMAEGLRDMLDKVLPMNFSGSFYVADKYAFAGSYRFPSSSAGEAYAQIKAFLAKMLPSMAGDDKMYSQVTLIEKHHKVNGIDVDRFSAVINTNIPLFKMPGQKEQLQAFWPGGKMEFDYAVKNNQILAAMPDRMQELMEQENRKSDWESAFNAGQGNCLAGYINFLGLITQVMRLNPAIPSTVKEKMEHLDSRGTAIRFQARMDGQMHSTARVPMKLFRELGRLNDR